MENAGSPATGNLSGGIVSNLNSNVQPPPTALRDALDQLDQIYRTAPVGMCLVDTELRYIRINQQLADINNTPIDQHIGKTIAEVIPKLAPYIEPAYRQVLETAEPITDVEIQTTTPQADSTPRDWVVNYYPFFDLDGQIRGVSVTVQDITEVKRTQREREEAFLTGLLKGQEQERSRLARELHEGVAQSFTGLAFHILALGQQGSDQMKEEAKTLADLASNAADALQRMAVDLHPLTLDQLGLCTALEQYISSMNGESQVEFDLQINGKVDENSLPNDVALTTYRVCQEALSNAIEHGKPSHINVKLIWEEHLLTLKVDDDGIGFDPDNIDTDTPKLGLTSMRERAHLAKGSLILSSIVGDGTSIRLELPLP